MLVKLVACKQASTEIVHSLYISVLKYSSSCTLPKATAFSTVFVPWHYGHVTVNIFTFGSIWECSWCCQHFLQMCSSFVLPNIFSFSTISCLMFSDLCCITNALRNILQKICTRSKVTYLTGNQTKHISKHI